MTNGVPSYEICCVSSSTTRGGVEHVEAHSLGARECQLMPQLTTVIPSTPSLYREEHPLRFHMINGGLASTASSARDIEILNSSGQGAERGRLIMTRRPDVGNGFQVADDPILGEERIVIGTCDYVLNGRYLNDEDRQTTQEYVTVVGGMDSRTSRDDWMWGNLPVDVPSLARLQDYEAFKHYWFSQWSPYVTPVRKEEVFSMALSEAFGGFFVHRVWAIQEYTRDPYASVDVMTGGERRLVLLVVLEVAPGESVKDFVQSLRDLSRRRCPGAGDELFAVVKCVVWRSQWATMWHPRGRCVLMTCEVPLGHRTSCLSTITVNPNSNPKLQVVGMLGIHPPYEREPQGVSPYGRMHDGEEFEPARGRILRPGVEVAGDRSHLNRFLIIAAIQNWDYLFCLDQNGVVNRIRDERVAAEILYRTGQIRNSKL